MGILQSPGFGTEVSVKRDCWWTLQTFQGNQLVLDFNYFQIKQKNNSITFCANYLSLNNSQLLNYTDGLSSLPFDDIQKIQVHDSGYIRFCDTVMKPKIVFSKTHILEIKFETFNEPMNHFSLSWTTNGCGSSVLTTSPKALEVMTYTGNMDEEYHLCEWPISAPVGKKVKVKVEYLGILNTDSDKKHCSEYNMVSKLNGSLETELRIFNGISDSAGAPRHCFFKREPREVVSDTNEMMLQFSYWRNNYVARNDTYLVLRVKFEFIDAGDLSCSGNYNGSNGILHSPNYPNPYPSLVECHWLISVAPGHSVTFKLKHLSVNNIVLGEGFKLNI